MSINQKEEAPVKYSDNTIRVLEGRYLLRDGRGRLIENPEGLFRRVAKVVAGAEALFGNTGAQKKWEEAFFKEMAGLKFLPNSPTLLNAGKEVQQLSACFVLPVEDSMEKIFDAVKEAAIIHKSGGGTGFSFSSLRPKGSPLTSTGGTSSGPVSFIEVFNTATEAIKQGGARRGANMAVLRIDHPDIIDFIRIKETPGKLTSFNLSVALTDTFLDALSKEDHYALIDPCTGKAVKKENAAKIFHLLTEKAWFSGEPGVLFIDTINKTNPTPDIGKIESTNPCGEQPLLPYESCNLGSVNLSKFVLGQDIDREALAGTVALAVRFLDNVIEVNDYPLEEIKAITLGNRKIGLGVMGFADLLILLGIPYNSAKAVQKGEEIMSFIDKEAKKASQELARQRGAFPNFAGSIYAKRNDPPLRNATVTTIAPTGTISLIADCSSGIEPLFAVAYKRKAMENTKLSYVHPHFLEAAKSGGFYSPALIEKIKAKGSISAIDEIPQALKRLLITAVDMDCERHIKMQTAFQRHTDNAVSKTINFPPHAKVEDVKEAIIMAHHLGCKGLTVYRLGSREGQPLEMCDYCMGRRG